MHAHSRSGKKANFITPEGSQVESQNPVPRVGPPLNQENLLSKRNRDGRVKQALKALTTRKNMKRLSEFFPLLF